MVLAVIHRPLLAHFHTESILVRRTKPLEFIRAKPHTSDEIFAESGEAISENGSEMYWHPNGSSSWCPTNPEMSPRSGLTREFPAGVKQPTRRRIVNLTAVLGPFVIAATSVVVIALAR